MSNAVVHVNYGVNFMYVFFKCLALHTNMCWRAVCVFCVDIYFFLLHPILTFLINQVSLFVRSVQAYDQHLNLILGEVEETVTTTEIDDETDEEIIKKQTRKVGMLFVRGDIVVLVSPPLRTG